MNEEVISALSRRWDNARFDDVRPGIRGATLQTGQLTMSVYVYDPGAVWENHSHPEDQVTFVHEGGEIVFSVDGRDILLGPGDLAVLPGGVAHAARVAVDGAPVVTVNVWRRRSSPQP